MSQSLIHLKSDNIEIMFNHKTDKVVEKFFSITYQIELQKSMRGADFISDYVYLLYYKCHKINFI